jgi:hypothetical protein
MKLTSSRCRTRCRRSALAVVSLSTVWTLVVVLIVIDPAAASNAAATVLTAFPATPPAKICGVKTVLNGPARAPSGFGVVPAGDNSGVNWRQPGALFWFAPGTHTLGGLPFSQIEAPANSVFLGAPGAIIDGQGINQYAFTQTASNVSILHLTVQNFVPGLDNGVVNHDSGANWTIQYNTITNNGGAGVMVGPGDVVSYNCLKSNSQYGFNAFHPGGNSNITIDHNEITGNNTGNWDVVIPGCGCVGGGKVWNTTNGSITNNWVHNNVGPGIWVDTDNAGILIDGNFIADNDEEAIIYEISYNAQITNNNILRNAYVKGRSFAAQNSTFPVGSIYISNSGGDDRVDNGLYSTFTIAGNNLTDNWGGVTLWEDANRFCGADIISTFCTLGSPATANVLTCAPVVINLQANPGDCRWKTQNVSVHDNLFNFKRTAVGCTNTGCGEQAILANSGTAPLWSPFMGNGIDTAITTQQNNSFANNIYTGDWKFAWGSTNTMTFSQWQGPPPSQDAGSTLNGVSLPPPPAGNALDADTATLEGSIGHWIPWFSAAVTQNASKAEAGTHSLKVQITAPNGWGVQLNNSPGFIATPGSKTIRFWGMSTVKNLGANLEAQWRDGAGNVLATSSASIGALTGTWQQASAAASAPAGTAFVTVTFTGTTGVLGNTLFLDEIYVGA